MTMKKNNVTVALLVIAVGVAILSIGTITSSAYATTGQGTPRQNPGQPPDPNCWGEINSGLAQDDFGDPGVGSHASDPVPGDDDRETPRDGVGNQAEDSPGEHAQTVGPQFGQECEP
jgi:hypothetical protein